MNYFAHGRPFLDDPYFLAGTAVPDWLNVVDRKVRATRKKANLFLDDADSIVATMARGIIQHHDDDRWFHQTLAFAELSWQFTADIRDVLQPDPGLRPSFLGHILVELLLDAHLIDRFPGQIQRYYQAVAELEPSKVTEAVTRIVGRPVTLMTVLLPRFVAERFLEDYVEDRSLLKRLNQVMRRVHLPVIPDEFLQILPSARRTVSARAEQLLARPS